MGISIFPKPNYHTLQYIYLISCLVLLHDQPSCFLEHHNIKPYITVFRYLAQVLHTKVFLQYHTCMLQRIPLTISQSSSDSIYQGLPIFLKELVIAQLIYKFLLHLTLESCNMCQIQHYLMSLATY